MVEARGRRLEILTVPRVSLGGGSCANKWDPSPWLWRGVEHSPVEGQALIAGPGSKPGHTRSWLDIACERRAGPLLSIPGMDIPLTSFNFTFLWQEIRR